MVKEAGVFELEMKPACVLSMNGDDPVEDAKQVMKAFNQQVSKHNQITRFALVEELPRTPLGKMALQQLPVLFADNEIER